MRGKSLTTAAAFGCLVYFLSCATEAQVITTDQADYTFGVYAENVVVDNSDGIGPPWPFMQTNTINTGYNTMPSIMYAYFWGLQNVRDTGVGAAEVGIHKFEVGDDTFYTGNSDEAFVLLQSDPGENIEGVSYWFDVSGQVRDKADLGGDHLAKYDIRFVVSLSGNAAQFKLSDADTWNDLPLTNPVSKPWPLSIQADKPFVMTARAFSGGVASVDVMELSGVDKTSFAPTAHPGDFDGDGDVDGADFVAWQTHFPTASGATLADGDADGDGDVDGADFVVWQTNFPFTPGSSVSPVPEPKSVIFLAMGGTIMMIFRRSQR